MKEKNKYQPYKHWTREQLDEILKRTAENLKFDPEVIEFISAIVYSINWNPSLEYDGCSVVQDHYHPSISCFVHDFFWRTGHGGSDSDKLFYKLMLKEGVNKPKAIKRYLGVRLAWFFYYKWKYINYKKRNEPQFNISIPHLLFLFLNLV